MVFSFSLKLSLFSKICIVYKYCFYNQKELIDFSF